MIQDVSGRSLPELVSLAGRVAVVTGASSGIGSRIAERLAEAGASLLLVDRDPGVSSLSDRLGSMYDRPVLSVVGDVADSATSEQAAEHAVAELGSLDVWVNDAGVFPVKAAVELSDQDWADCFAVDVHGTFFGARAAARRMQARGTGGVIVNIASSLGFRGIPMQAHYVAAKWAVRGMTAALAAEWGPDNIRVVAVAPGLTRSPGMLEVMAGVDLATGGDTAATFATTLPLRRLAEPDDIARAVLFAASDLGGFLTGSTVLADGGEVYSAGATSSS